VIDFPCTQDVSIPELRGLKRRFDLLRSHYDQAREQARAVQLALSQFSPEGDWNEELGWYREIEWCLRQATAATREYCKILDRRRHIDVVG
jgi:hypothetical protein